MLVFEELSSEFQNELIQMASTMGVSLAELMEAANAALNQYEEHQAAELLACCENRGKLIGDSLRDVLEKLDIPQQEGELP